MSRTYTITELAQEFDVTTRTIRFYEDQGLLSPQRRGQTRLYGPRDYVRLRLIMRGKRLGFPLKEIRELLDLYEADRTEVTQLIRLIAKIDERRAVLLKHQQDITTTLDELDLMEASCRKTLREKHAVVS